MVDATGKGRGCIENPEMGRKEVTILDATETMGSVKIVSEKFVDYLHLAKEAGQWVIVNVLWDYTDTQIRRQAFLSKQNGRRVIVRWAVRSSLSMMVTNFYDALTAVYCENPCQVLPNALWKTLAWVGDLQTSMDID